MKSLLLKVLGRASDLADVQPVIGLFLAGALLAVFFAALIQTKSANEPEAKSGLLWTLYHQLTRLVGALMVVLLLVGALSLLRVYLHQTLAHFQRTHGRITEANYNAVQSIWGAEQNQGELRMEIFYEEEVTERIESEDLSKPALLRKKIVRHDITANPFVAAHHEVTLRQNPRKKGSALYGGYETACRFTWRLKNPANRDLNSILKFPLPAAGAMYDEIFATLNDEDVLPRIQLKDASLILTQEWKPNEILELAIAFKSRGMSFWYLQVKEPREIRDFTLTLNLPDLPKARLNYPEGCMTPTGIKPTADNQGSILLYRLDHAISTKGMGISLPTLPQPGATTSAVLAEVERGWLLIFAMLVFGLTLAVVYDRRPIPQADRRASQDAEVIGCPCGRRVAIGALLSVLFAAATACIYGLMGDFSDFLFGFWGTAAFILLPMFVFLAWLLARTAPASGRLLALQLLLFGILYPSVAGFDTERQTLYFNLCGLAFLALAAWQLFRRLGGAGAMLDHPDGTQSAPSSSGTLSAT